jgi:hypothetical protein
LWWSEDGVQFDVLLVSLFNIVFFSFLFLKALPLHLFLGVIVLVRALSFLVVLYAYLPLATTLSTRLSLFCLCPHSSSIFIYSFITLPKTSLFLVQSLDPYMEDPYSIARSGSSYEYQTWPSADEAETINLGVYTGLISVWFLKSRKLM